MEIIKDQVSVLYGKIYKQNMRLLKKSENKGVVIDCAEVFDFYTTSHALSFLKDIYFDLTRSLGFVLNARCILEGIALKRLCKGKSDSVYSELLKRQKAILEYRCYHSFDEIKEYIVVPEIIEADYREASQYYKDTLGHEFGYSEKHIKSTIDSQIPFICEPRNNYRKIIGELLGEDYAKLYGLLSQMVHPSSNSIYRNNTLLEATKFVLEILLHEYEGIASGNHDLNYYCGISMTMPVPKRLQELMLSETSELFDLSNAIESGYGSNYISDSLRSICLIRSEMMLDIIMGFREQAKSKWKILLDIYAVFYEVIFVNHSDSSLIKLIDIHGDIQLSRNLHSEFSTDEAYSVYSSRFPNGADKVTFDSGFQTNIGYLVDVFGKSPSLTRIVKDFVRLFVSNTDNKLLQQVDYMNYLESQLLSHANGYLWFANSGAWNDIYGMWDGANNGLLLLMDSILQQFKDYSRNNEPALYKPLINLTRNGRKRLYDIAKEESGLFLIPAQSINDLS